MGGPRRSMDVNLSVVGGKHWTNEEKEQRLNSEVMMPKPDTLKPPKWLGAEAKKLFKGYAKEILDFPAGLVSNLDIGTLARYCDAEATYGEAAKHKDEWLRLASDRFKALLALNQTAKGDYEYDNAKAQVDYWVRQMSKLEKICRGCATEMGMTMSSRCKLVVPQASKPPAVDPLQELQKKFAVGGS